MFKFLLLIFLLWIFNACESKRPDNSSDVINNSHKEPVQKSRALRFDRRHLSSESDLGEEISKYIDQTQEPYDTATGDLNGDNLLDLMLVTRIKNEDSLHTEMIIGDSSINFEKEKYRRQLLVLLRNPDNTYTLFVRSLNAIPHLESCGMSADSYAGVGIEDGQIIIIQICRSRYVDISEFRFLFDKDKNNWYLDKLISQGFGPENKDGVKDTLSNDTLLKNNFKLTPISLFNFEDVKIIEK